MRAHTEIAGVVILAVACLSVGCSPPREGRAPDARSAAAPPSSPAPAGAADGDPDQVGLASWYGRAFAGKPTASGERFDPRRFTAAHKKLPFGTWVEVRRVDTGGVVRVRINDRGPNGRAAHRIIDLSERAAEELGIVRAGVARVELRVVSRP